MTRVLGYTPDMHWAPRHIRRSQTVVTVTSAGVQLVGANPNRIGLVISCPNQENAPFTNQLQALSNIDGSVAGVKLIYTVPGGLSAMLNSATQVETVGTGILGVLELVRSAVVTKLVTFLTTASFSGRIDLSSGDTIRMNLVTAVAASFCDMSMDIVEVGFVNRITLSVNRGQLIDQGITLYPGDSPLILWKDVIGDALTEDIYAVARGANVPIGIWDLFY